MKKILMVMISLLLLFSFAGCSNSGQGKLGGELVIYTPNSDSEVEAIIPYFEEKFGIQVKAVIASVEDCIERIKSEANAPQADVLWGGMTYSVYQQYPDLWEEYVSANDENIEEESYKNTTGFFSQYCLSGTSPFIVNIDEMAKAGLTLNDIKGYKNLIDHEAKLKGKVLMEDPLVSEPAYSHVKSTLYLFSTGEESDWDKRDFSKGWEYVAKFVDLIEAKTVSSSAAVCKTVQEGGAIVGLTNEAAVVNMLREGAETIAVVYPEEGCCWTAYGVSIVKNAPHMERAKTFVDWLLSEEAQQLYSKYSLRPILSGVSNETTFMPSLDDLKVFTEDTEFTFSQRNEWLDKWRELIKSH